MGVHERKFKVKQMKNYKQSIIEAGLHNIAYSSARPQKV